MTQQQPPPPPPTPPPFPSGPYPSDPTPPRRSWWGRNWKWVVPVGCLTPIILCGGLLTMIFTVAFGTIKSSEPYKQSLAQVQQSADVQAALGTPIEAGWLVGGNIDLESANGSANLVYNVSGPKGGATVQAVANKSAGTWTFESISVIDHANNRTINIVGDGGGSDAPIEPGASETPEPTAAPPAQTP